MTEHPTLFNGEMVRAILAGRKTQTRRPVTKRTSICSSLPWDALQLLEAVSVGQHLDVPGSMGIWHQVRPHVEAGDQLWVRETWALTGEGQPDDYPTIHYRADSEQRQSDYRSLSEPLPGCPHGGPWRPSIHMPRWASRITLDVTAVRVERLRAISGDDMVAEGVRHDGTWWLGSDHPAKGTPKCFPAIEYALADRWDDIYAERGYGWAKNPWVWVIEFRRAQP